MNEKVPSNGFFYGWWIAGFALLSMIITNGSTIGGLSVFYQPMLDDLQNLDAITDVTRPEITAFGGAVTLYTIAIFAIPEWVAIMQSLFTRSSPTLFFHFYQPSF